MEWTPEQLQQIKDIAAAAPPLTQDQRDKLKVLLAPVRIKPPTVAAEDDTETAE